MLEQEDTLNSASHCPQAEPPYIPSWTNCLFRYLWNLMYGSLLMTCPVQSPWPESCLMLIHTPETSGSPYSWLRAVLCSSPGRTAQCTKTTSCLWGSLLLGKSAVSEEPSLKKKCTYVSGIQSGLDPQARDHRAVVQEFQHLAASRGILWQCSLRFPWVYQRLLAHMSLQKSK